MKKRTNISRRSLLQGGAAVAGWVAASRVTGSKTLTGEARAAPADAFALGKRHVLIVNLLGGFNAVFPSSISFRGAGTFGVTGDNMVTQIVPAAGTNLGYAVDAPTFGTLSPFLLQHSAAVGIRHGSSAHGQAEALVMSNGTRSYPLMLAAAMQGDASIKAAVLGTGVNQVAGPKPTESGVSLQQIADMSTTIAALGGGGDPSIPDRGVGAAALTRAKSMSSLAMGASPTMLTSVTEGFDAAIATLQKPAQVFDINAMRTAYGVTGTAVTSVPSKFLAAELMFLAGANVALIQDGFNWDSHGDTTANNVRNRMNTTILPGLKTFLARMVDSSNTAAFTAPDRNVTVVVLGDFSRSLPGSDHQANLTSWICGTRVKAGSTGTVAANVSLPATAGNVIDQYNLLGKLTGAAGDPFGTSTINDGLLLP